MKTILAWLSIAQVAMAASGGLISEYNATTGAAINTALVSGLSAPNGMAIAGREYFCVQ